MDVGLQKCLTGGLRPAPPLAPDGADRRHCFSPNRLRIRPPDGVSSAAILPRHSALRPQGRESHGTVNLPFRDR